jgi:alpha-aminoadipate/glutamate carrier protein LysW
MRGQVVRCADCGVELEVTAIEPVRVELAPQVEEDWGE